MNLRRLALALGVIAVGCGGLVSDHAATGDGGPPYTVGVDASTDAAEDAPHDALHDVVADAPVPPPHDAAPEANPACPPIVDAPNTPVSISQQTPDSVVAASGGLVLVTNSGGYRSGDCYHFAWWPFAASDAIPFGGTGCYYFTNQMAVRGAEAWLADSSSLGSLDVYDLGPASVSPAQTVLSTTTDNVVAGPAGVVYYVDRLYYLASPSAKPVALDTPPGVYSALAIGPTAGYAADDGGSTQQALWRIPLSGAPATQVLSATYVTRAVPLDASLVYVEVVDTTDRLVAVHAGGKVDTVRDSGSPLGGFSGVEVDKDYVYWAEYDSSTERIYRRRHCGGAPQLMFTGHVQGLTSDATHLYWVGDQGIMQLSK